MEIFGRKKEIDFDIGESKQVSNKLEENKQNKNEK